MVAPLHQRREDGLRADLLPGCCLWVCEYPARSVLSGWRLAVAELKDAEQELHVISVRAE
jgi:hypothetical protein